MGALPNKLRTMLTTTQTTMATSNSIDLIASADKAVGLISNETQGPLAQQAFMRVLGQSDLSHFEWFYLLTTLLALKDRAQANVPLPQAACDASA
jgi:hypothetical protein